MLEVIIFLLALAADQITKIWAASTLPLFGGSLAIIQDVLHFTYSQNYGAAFGILQNQRVFFLIATPLAMILFVIVIISGHKSFSKSLLIGLALFLSGAMGNFLDRLILTYVRDFVDFRLINFAIFNVADSCITIGFVLIAIDVLILDARRKKKLLASQAQSETLEIGQDASTEESPSI